MLTRSARGCGWAPKTSAVPPLQPLKSWHEIISPTLPFNIEIRKTYDICQPLKEKGRAFFPKEPHLIFPWVANNLCLTFMGKAADRYCGNNIFILKPQISCYYHGTSTNNDRKKVNWLQQCYQLVVAAQSTLLRILKLGRSNRLIAD